MSEEARRRALAPEGSFLVQAPAGSGKTELLTRRILTLLSVVDEPEEILAITFTRKAAAEMRMRVQQALRMPRPAPDDPAFLRWELAQRALARSESRGWRLERHPARLKVMTIDALAAGLARRLPLLSGLGETPAPTEDAGVLYREAAEAVLDAALHDPDLRADAECLLLHQDNRMPQVLDLMAAMLARRETWLPFVAGHGRNVAAFRAHLEANVAAVMRARLVAADARAPADLKRKLPALLHFAAANLGEEVRNPAAWPEPVPERIATWKRMARLLLTDRGTVRSPRGINVNAGFPKGAGCEKKRMGELLGQAAAAPAFVEALRAVTALPDAPVFDDGQWRIVEALLRLLSLAAAELTARFAARGTMDFTGIALSALEALCDDEGRPTDVLLRLDGRIRHILVDEFQDTSELQIRLLRGLTAGWEKGEGRTLFLVGDPMQSIYRFRKADVGLFLRAAENAAGLPAGTPLRLVRNFRSTHRLVEWLNRAFSAIFPAAADAVHGSIPYASAAAAHASGGEDSGVHLYLRRGRNDAAEAARVVALARAARDRGRKVGILGRTRMHLREVVRALSEAGVPFRAVDVLPLSDTAEARELRALARALLHPCDDDAWLGVLRMPCCGLDTRDLWTLLEGRDGGIGKALNDEDRLARLADARRVRFVRAALAPCVKAAGRMPVRELVETAWRRLGMPALLDDTARANAARVLDVLEKVEEEGGIAGGLSFARLDAMLGGLYAAADTASEAADIEVLTMHGAKGLQWDAVILPGLGRGRRRREAPLLAFTETVTDGDAALLVAAKPPVRGSDAMYDLVRGIEQAREEQEARRLLYVACTRARQELHLLGHVDERRMQPEKGSFMELLSIGGEEYFGARIHEMDEAVEAAETGASDGITRVIAPPPVPPVAPSAAVPATEYVWAGIEAAPVGNAVHAILEWIGRMGVESWSEALRSELRERACRVLVAEGLSGETLERARARVEKAVDNALASERGRWALSGRHREAHCEWELCTREGGDVALHVIDRAFVDEDGVRWIVDYKTAGHEGGDRMRFLDAEARRHGPQLARYARTLKQMEPWRRVRAALYFPLLDAWREIDVDAAGGA